MKNKNRNVITPLFSMFYRNNQYSNDEIALLESMLSPEETFKYSRLCPAGCTNKQRFMAISSLIDLYTFKK